MHRQGRAALHSTAAYGDVWYKRHHAAFSGCTAWPRQVGWASLLIITAHMTGVVTGRDQGVWRQAVYLAARRSAALKSSVPSGKTWVGANLERLPLGALLTPAFWLLLLLLLLGFLEEPLLLGAAGAGLALAEVSCSARYARWRLEWRVAALDCEDV
jgi:hypothetical protein